MTSSTRSALGYGKAREVPLAISKAVEDAKKNMFVVPAKGTTITHEISASSVPHGLCSGRPAKAPG